MAGIAEERVMLLRAVVPGGTSVGSGTLIGPRLVLTAAHVVFDAGSGQPAESVEVLPLSEGQAPGRVVWPDRYRSSDDPGARRDAALVLIADESWVPPRLGPVRWGRLTGRAPGVGCEAVGFPRALRGEDLVRDSDHVSGTVNPLSRRIAGRYDLTVGSVPKELEAEASPWQGASGSGLFANGLLIGVLVVDEQRYQGRLSALPIHRLAHDDSFTAALAEHGAGSLSPADLESVELVGLVEPVLAPGWAGPRRGPHPSPARLLTADREVVPFHGRADLLDELTGWCADPMLVDLRLIVGPGGQGKTRLARQLARDLAGQPDADGRAWTTGLLTQAADQRARVADTDGSLLVVVDYAESRAGQVTDLIRALWAADSTARGRVLLLARGAGEWWTQLTDQLQLAADAVTVLPGLDQRGDPAGGFTAALAALADRLPEVQPDVDWVAVAGHVAPPADLADTRYRVPLTLQLAALVGLLEAHQPLAEPSGDPARPRWETAEETLLKHERTYWTDTAAAAGLGLSGDGLAACVAAATLCGAQSRAQGTTMLDALPALGGKDADTRRRVNTWLAGRYPPAPGQWWGSLQPDRVGEYQAATTLLGDPALLPALLTAASDTQAHQAFTVSTRALANPSLTTDQKDTLADQVGRTLAGNLERLGPLAMQVATQAADPRPLVAVLNTATTYAPPEALATLAGALPDTSLALAPLAEELTTRLVDHYRTAIAGPDDTDTLAALANSLNDQAVRLAALGRREDALAAIDEAVTLRRGLAAARPDAFTPNLAMSLNNQANRLAALGRREDALAAIDEAVTLRRGLAAARPDAFTPDLAMALNTQSNQLAALGRREDALAAAEEAVTSYRGLAAARPDAFTPNLAGALNTQSNQLAALGRQEDALAAIEEAVTSYRGLAAARPDAFTPNLAGALNNQSNQLAALGRQEDALAAIEEAVTSYRGLAAARPDAFTPNLAGALNNQSGCLAALGRREDALAAIEEAVTWYRGLAAARPDAFTPALATSLNSQSNQLAALGRREDALAAIEEAVTSYRGLATARPDAFTPSLAISLTTLGIRLTDAELFDEARHADQEAVLLYRDLQQRWPGVYSEPLRRAADNLAIDLRDLGHPPEAIETILGDLLGDDTLAQLTETADQADTPASSQDQWQPILAAAEAIARGTAPRETVDALNTLFDELAAVDDWAALIPVLRRIIAGDHPPDLLHGLDPTDTAIATDLLDRFNPNP